MKLSNRTSFILLARPVDPRVELEPVHPLAVFAAGVFALFCFLTAIGSL